MNEPDLTQRAKEIWGIAQTHYPDEPEFRAAIAALRAVQPAPDAAPLSPTAVDASPAPDTGDFRLREDLLTVVVNAGKSAHWNTVSDRAVTPQPAPDPKVAALVEAAADFLFWDLKWDNRNHADPLGGNGAVLIAAQHGAAKERLRTALAAWEGRGNE